MCMHICICVCVCACVCASKCIHVCECSCMCVYAYGIAAVCGEISPVSCCKTTFIFCIGVREKGSGYPSIITE